MKTKLPAWATTVTPLSRTIALLMFILLPVAAFYYGMYYQQKLDAQKPHAVGTIIIVKPTPTVSLPITPTPINLQNGKISCQTNADCPPDYLCTQAGPIIFGAKQHRTCWKKGSPMPL